jgi:hypothetical protein
VGADEGAGDAGEGEEVLGFAFVAAVESTASGEPGHRARILQQAVKLRTAVTDLALGDNIISQWCDCSVFAVTTSLRGSGLAWAAGHEDMPKHGGGARHAHPLISCRD